MKGKGLFYIGIVLASMVTIPALASDKDIVVDISEMVVDEMVFKKAVIQKFNSLNLTQEFSDLGSSNVAAIDSFFLQCYLNDSQYYCGRNDGPLSWTRYLVPVAKV